MLLDITIIKPLIFDILLDAIKDRVMAVIAVDDPVIAVKTIPIMKHLKIELVEREMKVSIVLFNAQFRLIVSSFILYKKISNKDNDINK